MRFAGPTALWSNSSSFRSIRAGLGRARKGNCTHSKREGGPVRGPPRTKEERRRGTSILSSLVRPFSDAASFLQTYEPPRKIYGGFDSLLRHGNSRRDGGGGTLKRWRTRRPSQKEYSGGRVSLELEHARGPGESRSEGGEHYYVAFFHFPFLDGLVERDRN